MISNFIEVYEKAYKTANSIFMNPKVLYCYDDIIKGARIRCKNMQAVDNSTFQAFGRNKNMVKVKDVFISYFLSNKNRIVELLNNVKNRDDFEKIELTIFSAIYSKLLKDTDPSRLKSYNRIRKPINLYMEHIVSMSEEIKNRSTLVPMLYLPLDRIIFGSEYTLSNYERVILNVNPNAGFGQVTEKVHYDKLQTFFMSKSEELSKTLGHKFYRIYFDMFWKERYLSNSDNLFLSNLKAPQDYADNAVKEIKSDKMEYSRDSEVKNSVIKTFDNNSQWNKLNDYKKETQALVKLLAEMLSDNKVDLAPKFRGDKAIAFTPRGKNNKNILTVWEKSRGIRVLILQYCDVLCTDKQDFIFNKIVEGAIKKYDAIR